MVTITDSGDSETFGEALLQLWPAIEESDECKHELQHKKIILETTSPIMVFVKLTSKQRLKVYTTVDRINFVSLVHLINQKILKCLFKPDHEKRATNQSMCPAFVQY